VTPRSTSVNEGEASPSPQQGGAEDSPAQPAPEAPAPQRLEFGRYDAPKSYHASRAFAEMQERAALRAQTRKRRGLLLLAGVGVCLVVLISMGNMLARWLAP
jgi:hypothetical protein